MINGTDESSPRMLMQDAQVTHFRERVRTRVFQLLSDAPPVTFEHILKRSLNCDPAFLLDIIHELQDADFITSTDGQDACVRYSLKLRHNYRRTKSTHLNQSAATPRLRTSLNSAQHQHLRELLQEMLDSFPEPAPVYSQWWFSESVYEHLINLVLHLSKPRAPLAFLGSGTLGAVLSHFSAHPISIFDVDTLLLERIGRYCSDSTRTIRYDVSNEVDASFKNAFTFVLADPPWSSHLLRTFLIRSSTLVSIPGTLAVSFPPVLTRPSAKSERQALLKLAESLGLSLMSTLPSFTEYSVPAFEQRAYEHYGIRLKEPWRTGDLFIFAKNSDTSIEVTSLVDKLPEWNQYHHAERRLFLKRDGLFEEGPPSVEPISGSEDLICKSTSSRMACWKSASFVSTRNHIAHAYGRKELSVLLERTFEQNHSNHEKGSDFPAILPSGIQDTILAMLNIAKSDETTPII